MARISGNLHQKEARAAEMTVVSLEDHKEQEQEHISGEAQCLGCQAKWYAVAPADVEFFECPECSLMKGVFSYPVVYCDYDHWECGCGNDLFHITEDGAYCPGCGDWQSW